MPIFKEYFSKYEEHAAKYGDKVVVLYQVGSFYEIYGLDGDASYDRMIQVGNETGLNIVSKHNTKGEQVKYRQKGLFMMGCKPENVDKYVEVLLGNGWIIPVYIQRTISKNNHIRELDRIITPGTYVYANAQTSNNILMVAWLSKSKPLVTKSESLACGIAVLNYITGDCYVHNYRKDRIFESPLDYDDLESFYSAYNPSEFTLITDNISKRQVANVINWLRVPDDTVFRHVSLQAKDSKVDRYTRQQYQKELLLECYVNLGNKLFVDTFVMENGFASSALCYLLDFVRLQNKDIYHKLKHPRLFKQSNYLRLANHSLVQLNIIDSKQHTGPFSSVVSFLTRHCLTEIGRRVMRSNIINPILDGAKLTSVYNVTEHIKSHSKSYETVIKKMRTIVDIERYRTKIINKSRVPCGEFDKLYNSILSIKTSIETMREVYTLLETDEPVSHYLRERMTYSRLETVYNTLTEYLSSVIAPSRCSSSDVSSFCPAQYFTLGINEAFGNVFAELHDGLAKIEAIRKGLNSFLRRVDKSKDPFELNETALNHVFTLQTTSSRSTKFQNMDRDVRGCVSLSYSDLFDKKHTFEFSLEDVTFKKATASSSKRIVSSPFIDDAMMILSRLKNKYISVVSASFDEVIEGIRSRKEEFEHVVNHIACLDGVFTRAIIAQKYNYCTPIIAEGDKSFMIAKELRHTLIEHVQTDEIYKPNNIVLGDEDQDVVLLYGVNAVGKSSFIKSIGISIVMAQSGFFVPASAFTYKPYERLFTRILGNDNIFKGLSTFQVEMSELNSILHFADSNSLVIGDELCSGTEMVSALSIFCSGIEHLHSSYCSAIFATHLHEVAGVSNVTELDRVNIKHMSIKYNTDSGLLEYDRVIRDGFGERCYGLEVCKSLNMPAKFMDQAWSIRAKIQPKFQSMFMRKTSRYNTNKIITNCERCGSADNVETHHMQPQKDADENGFIRTFPKNHPANLQILCKRCHLEITRNGTVTRRVKTLSGDYTVIQ